MTLTRIVTGTLSVVLGAGSLLAVAPTPAHAAWQTSTNIHAGKLQVCKDERRDGTQLVRARLHNGAARHAHQGGFSRTRGNTGVAHVFEVRAGRISAVTTMTRRPGDTFTSWVGEVDGPSAGGGLGRYADLPRC